MNASRAMNEIPRIETVEKDDDDGVLVTFSDGTSAGYVVEELLLLRPNRIHAEEPLKQERPATTVKKITFPIDVPYAS